MRLRNKLSKKFKVTTDSTHNYLTVENVLNREFNPKTPSKVRYQKSPIFIPKRDFYVSLRLLIYMTEK